MSERRGENEGGKIEPGCRVRVEKSLFQLQCSESDSSYFWSQSKHCTGDRKIARVSSCMSHPPPTGDATPGCTFKVNQLAVFRFTPLLWERSVTLMIDIVVIETPAASSSCFTSFLSCLTFQTQLHFFPLSSHWLCDELPASTATTSSSWLATK